jgi:hypothetical protein
MRDAIESECGDARFGSARSRARLPSDGRALPARRLGYAQWVWIPWFVWRAGTPDTQMALWPSSEFVKPFV